jgi:ABC-2 type transport system permease protein
VDSSPQVEQAVSRMGGQTGLVNAFLAAIMGFFALLASAYAVQATLRLRSEETSQRAEPLLATRVSRLGFTLSHLLVAVLGAALLLALAGVAEGLTHGARAGDVGTQVLRLLGAGLAQLPAVLVLAGLATALFGLAPQLTQLSWAVLVGFVLLGQFGPVFRLNQAIMDISPFTHIPKLPGTAFTAVPLSWLALIAAALIGAGLFGIRRRDIG